MVKDQFEKWEKRRAKGKWNFILVYGVLAWGVGTGAAFSLIFPLAMEAVGSRPPFLPVFALSIVGFALGGVAWGYGMWTYLERVYRKTQGPEIKHKAEVGTLNDSV
jgi:membrane protein implicated in regulation of membrane protease activity